MPVKPIPEGYHSITPYLITNNAKKALEYYKQAFDAMEVLVMEHDGKVSHCEFRIGDSVIMMADEYPDMQNTAPSGDNRYSTLLLYVNNVDKTFGRAVEFGAKVIMEPKNQFYGDRMSTVMDPFGHKWHIATHIEDLSPEEMRKRAASA